MQREAARHREQQAQPLTPSHLNTLEIAQDRSKIARDHSRSLKITSWLPVSIDPQARANRGILYVDEVNLLDDGLVDVVLDSAASGINTVEREGISIAHPAKFIMIGSGNPQVRAYRSGGSLGGWLVWGGLV